MAFLLLAVFGYLQLAEADGRSLQRIVSTGMVLWWEFTSCSENCCYYHWAAADLPGITKGLQKARTHTEVCRRLLRSAGHNISRKLNKGWERGTEKLKEEKKSKNTSLLCELTWRARVLGEKIRFGAAVKCLCVPPPLHTVWMIISIHRTFPVLTQVFLSCFQIILQALRCFMYHWNVFIWRLNRQLHVFHDLGGEKQSTELTPHMQR